jgi:hypothetical protein
MWRAMVPHAQSMLLKDLRAVRYIAGRRRREARSETCKNADSAIVRCEAMRSLEESLDLGLIYSAIDLL